MREIDKVLTATDFSRGARAAAKVAKIAADIYGAKLVAAHILQHMDETISLLVEDVDEVQRQAEREAEENIGSLLTDLQISQDRSRSVVAKGSPVAGLIRVALQDHADLVVAGMMGSTRDVRSGTLGGVVEQLIMAGLFDLLLVREDRATKFQQIAVGTDFSEYADLALERGIDITQRVDATELHIIHAYDWPQGYSKLGLSPEETDAKCRESAQRNYDKLIERIPAPEGLTYHPVFVRGRPDEAVRDACLHNHVDLLIIGAAGRTAAAVALIGNVALKIARQSPCSVWITRPAGLKLTFFDGIRRLMGLECQES